MTCNDIILCVFVSCDLGLKLHRSLRVCAEDYHGAEDGAVATAETSETHTGHGVANAA